MALDATDLDALFRTARSHNRWHATPVTAKVLRELYEVMKWGPTSANCSPARFVFVTGAAARTKLLACVSQGNQIKVETAPVTVIIGMDEKFHDNLPKLFPHAPDARNWFLDPQMSYTTAFRNATLQGAYLMLAARAMGLNCGPMSGFDNAKVDAAFFAGTSIKSNFLCCIGHGSEEGLFGRLPRLDFDDACRIE